MFDCVGWFSLGPRNITLLVTQLHFILAHRVVFILCEFAHSLLKCLNLQQQWVVVCLCLFEFVDFPFEVDDEEVLLLTGEGVIGHFIILKITVLLIINKKWERPASTRRSYNSSTNGSTVCPSLAPRRTSRGTSPTDVLIISPDPCSLNGRDRQVLHSQDSRHAQLPYHCQCTKERS